MVRLIDIQRGRAIALLMQGQRQQQVANHFGVERLVRRLRETGHLADRPRSGRPRVTSRRISTMYDFVENCQKSFKFSPNPLLNYWYVLKMIKDKTKFFEMLIHLLLNVQNKYSWTLNC